MKSGVERERLLKPQTIGAGRGDNVRFQLWVDTALGISTNL